MNLLPTILEGMEKKEDDILTFGGIADCHGIESFHLREACNMGLLEMRCQHNQQRHAITYEADLNRKSASVIIELLEDSKYEDALKTLKCLAREIRTTKQAYKKNFKLIPNPELDPYA